MGGFRVRDKMIFVLRVNQIPIGGLAVYTLPPLGLGQLHRPDFLGGIAGVKLIEQVLLGKGTKSFEKARIYAGLRRIGS